MNALSLLALAAIQSPTPIPVDEASVIEYIGNSQQIIEQPSVNPYDLAGSLIIEKDGKRTYQNILAPQQREILKPQDLTDSRYRSMIKHETAASIGFLSFLGVETSETDLIEVAVQEKWRMDAPPLFGDESFTRKVLAVAKLYGSQGYTTYYNSSAKYSLMTTSRYSESNASLRSAFNYVDASGKVYAQSSDYRQRDVIEISSIPLNPLFSLLDGNGGGWANVSSIFNASNAKALGGSESDARAFFSEPENIKAVGALSEELERIQSDPSMMRALEINYPRVVLEQ